MTAALERPVIGTTFLSRFLPTLDYRGGRLSCARRAARRRAPQRSRSRSPPPT
jgi:hypothetical protein